MSLYGHVQLRNCKSLKQEVRVINNSIEDVTVLFVRCCAAVRFAARLILSDPIRFQQRAGMSAPDPSIEISTPRLLQQKPKPPTFFERSTEAVASVTAKSWASVKANKLSLSLNRTDADTDGDGLLTREEYVAKRQHHQLLLRLVNSSSTRARACAGLPRCSRRRALLGSKLQTSTQSSTRTTTGN